MSNDDFTKALVKICEDRFGDVIRVTLETYNGKTVGWIVGPPEELTKPDPSWYFEWHIYRESARKFGGKHPHCEFGYYMLAVMQNELAYRYNGRISDEGVPNTWAGDPKKESLKSFRAYLFNYLTNFLEPDDPKVQQRIDQSMECTPEALRDL